MNDAFKKALNIGDVIMYCGHGVYYIGEITKMTEEKRKNVRVYNWSTETRSRVIPGKVTFKVIKSSSGYLRAPFTVLPDKVLLLKPKEKTS